MSSTCEVCRGAIPNGETVTGHTALCAQVLTQEVARLREALETITHSHPSLVTRGGGPAPWLIAKAALLNMPLRYGYDYECDMDVVVAEWAKTEPAVSPVRTTT